jgi:uncharacterized protein
MWARREWLAAAIGAASRLVRGETVPYQQQIAEWRRKREASLKAVDGWLTVTGLQWLHEGINKIDGVEGVAFDLQSGRTIARIGAGSGALVNGQAIREAELNPDNPGPPDKVTLGSRTMFVIERGGRIGMRVRDTNSRFRRQFTGLRWYPVDAAYRVRGTLKPHPAPLSVSIPTILGFDEKMTSPGIVHFQLRGELLALRPVLSEGSLFFIFRDRTAGKTTYPAGRFLYADVPGKGEPVDLDFNKAYNPPCAFTPYATCPLPPRENHLPIEIAAGELNYHHQ